VIIWSPLSILKRPLDAAPAAPAKRCALNQVITVFTLAGDMGKWRKRLPLS
jgi:hypothetical protein